MKEISNEPYPWVFKGGLTSLVVAGFMFSQAARISGEVPPALPVALDDHLSVQFSLCCVQLSALAKSSANGKETGGLKVVAS